MTPSFQATQSIIVYRNPLEQMVWEGALNGPIFPIIIGTVVFFLMVISTAHIVERYKYSVKRRWIAKAYNFIVFGPATIVSILLVKYMWI